MTCQFDPEVEQGLQQPWLLGWWDQVNWSQANWKSEQRSKQVMTHGNKPILLVEDEMSSVELFRSALESWGYPVWVAADGEEALLTVGSRAPAAVIADVAIPGAGGLDLLRRLRQADPNAIVILYAAHACLQTAISAIRGGAADLLSKPIDFERLKHLLDDLLGERVSSNPDPTPGLSPSDSGNRPPESNLAQRDTRPHRDIPQCRDRLFP